jgi:hypothetical protein
LENCAQIGVNRNKCQAQIIVFFVSTLCHALTHCGHWPTLFWHRAPICWHHVFLRILLISGQMSRFAGRLQPIPKECRLILV